jgi:hypothetical protein
MFEFQISGSYRLNKEILMNLRISIGVLLLLGSTGCDSKPASTQQSVEAPKSTAASSSPVAGAATFDPCSLITPPEVAVVVGQPVKETKGSSPTMTQTGPSFQRWQCFYTVEPYEKSVSLELARNNPNGSQTAVSEFWKEKLQDAKDKRKSVKPRLIPAVGEEAFWVGDNKTGALYVLKNNSYLRISIGGPDEESEKIKKLQVLAQNALKRL